MRRLITAIFFLMVPALAVARSNDIVVASDGSGQFLSVQAAVDSIGEDYKERIVVHIKPGTYRERITVGQSRTCISFEGDPGSAARTILSFNLNAKSEINGKAVGTRNSASTTIDASDFVAENITFENTAGDNGQAVALRSGGERNVFRNCRFIGWQDTLYPNEGRCYFSDCYIEGRTDFIFGKATCVFDRCTIHSKNGGFVTAAATPAEHAFGFVFLDCKLTGGGAPALLGRPWRPFAAVAFIRCEIGSHIDPVGWNNWGKTDNEETSRFSEYYCTGPGASRDHRVGWSHEMTADDAAKYTVANVLAATDGWNGTPATIATHTPASQPSTTQTTGH